MPCDDSANPYVHRIQRKVDIYFSMLPGDYPDLNLPHLRYPGILNLVAYFISLLQEAGNMDFPMMTT